MLTDDEILRLAPSTRYQGSKRKILPWIYKNLKQLKFQTVLDGFGGTGSVSYLFKLMGKQVVFNDILKANYLNGLALIENDSIILEKNDIDFILKNGFKYPSFIQDTFKGIYFLNSENKWLDMVIFNIEKLADKYAGKVLQIKKALAYYALFQACLCKRPFNLFHRKNLNLRTSNLERSFGNKTTWDKKFSQLLVKFCVETSNKVFSNDKRNKTLQRDIMNINNTDFDLVYLDPPYAKNNSKPPNDYYILYHFFEGILNYNNWANMIDWKTKNKRLIKEKTSWGTDPIDKNFDILFNKFRKSIIVISYGDPGYPSIKVICNLLSKYKSNIRVKKIPYNYKLNQNNGNGLYEALIIGK